MTQWVRGSSSWISNEYSVVGVSSFRGKYANLKGRILKRWDMRKDGNMQMNMNHTQSYFHHSWMCTNDLIEPRSNWWHSGWVVLPAEYLTNFLLLEYLHLEGSIYAHLKGRILLLKRSSAFRNLVKQREWRNKWPTLARQVAFRRYPRLPTYLSLTVLLSLSMYR